MFLDMLELRIERKKNVSEIHKNDLFCPYNLPKISNTFMFFCLFVFSHFFLVVLWTHQPFFDKSETTFSKPFFLFFVLFCNLHSKMSRNMCKWHHKVRNGPILPTWSPNLGNYFFLKFICGQFKPFHKSETT